MPPSGLEGLEAELGDSLPAGLSALSDEQLGDLAQAVKDARRRQAAALAAAGERALEHIPRLLRGPVRRVVG
jgi:hypothetical protein